MSILRWWNCIIVLTQYTCLFFRNQRFLWYSSLCSVHWGSYQSLTCAITLSLLPPVLFYAYYQIKIKSVPNTFTTIFFLSFNKSHCKYLSSYQVDYFLLFSYILYFWLKKIIWWSTVLFIDFYLHYCFWLISKLEQLVSAGNSQWLINVMADRCIHVELINI